MAQPALRVVGLLNSLFVLLILALRLLPNDDAAIRTLLLPPDGCPAPCFMNIRAGQMSSDEATTLINQHMWAKSPPFFIRSINDMHERFVLWRWSGQQPSGVDIHKQGVMRVYQNRVIGMVFNTTIPLGAVWLVLGATDRGTISLPQVRSDRDIMVVMVYPAHGLLVRVVVPKQGSQADLWTSVAEIESSNAQAIAYFGGYHLPVLARLGSAK